MAKKRKVKRKIKFAQFVPSLAAGMYTDEGVIKDSFLKIELRAQTKQIFNMQVEVTYEIEEEEEVASE